MASAVDICNVALSHLGNARRVAAIDPPDGSAEADLCSTFYPIARDELLESGDWAFARTRVALAEDASNPSETWSYAYAKPSDCIMPRRVITSDATQYEQDSEPFDSEGELILANKAEAVLIYTRSITDTTKMPNSFRAALGYLLASYLAGPIIKGDEGAKASASLRKVASSIMATAMAQDANRTGATPQHYPGALAARNGLVGSTAPSNNEYQYESGYAIN